MDSAADQIVEHCKDYYFASKNAGMYYINLRWANLRPYTDLFDKRLLELLGLEDQWRNLNIWYRKTMRSFGENSNGIDLSRQEIETYENYYKNSHLT